MDEIFGKMEKLNVNEEGHMLFKCTKCKHRNCTIEVDDFGLHNQMAVILGPNQCPWRRTPHKSKWK